MYSTIIWLAKPSPLCTCRASRKGRDGLVAVMIILCLFNHQIWQELVLIVFIACGRLLVSKLSSGLAESNWW